MSCYNDNPFGSLYDTGDSNPTEQEQTTAVVPASAPAAPSSSGVVEAVEVIASPVALLEDAVTPGETKLPWGLAVLGACIVAVIFANSIDSKVGRG